MKFAKKRPKKHNFLTNKNHIFLAILDPKLGNSKIQKHFSCKYGRETFYTESW